MGSVKFKATDEQLGNLFATAANASIPAGMGFLHFRADRVFTADDFRGVTSTDYVEGRMVKLHPRFLGDGVYEIGEPQYDANDMERTYQSWGCKYPTARDLILAAGLEPIEDEQKKG